MKQSLSGTWHFRMNGDEHWQLIDVPGCWEALGLPKNRPGPTWYRREIVIPPEWAGKRLWLRFDGVSYACRVLVNGQEVGEHIGLWDGFRLEITGAVQPGETAELLVEVEKPASLTAGPDSPAVPGRFPQKETLSGFLPYVWGHIFGGIWQDVWLEATERVVIEEACIRADHHGNIRGEVRLSEPAEVELEIRDPEGRVVLTSRGQGPEVLFVEKIMPPRPWSPADPALYEAVLSVSGGEEVSRKLGMRGIRADGSALLLNDAPIYPRMILSWGWYEQSLHANPGREQVRRDFERLKSLGYNGVKLCLWVPPAYYFDLADEMGMLLWLELPMWMPETSEFFLEQTPIEYERIVRQVRHHPSVILYTLGCELDAKVRADFLEPLYRQTKALIGDALLRDNSGSGEAYGGLLNEFAEYYDYHFYSDIQFFRPLLDHFAPRWRPQQPFLFGEFCDSDTWRDLRKLYATGGGKLPWWARDDAEENPKGARWQHDVGVIEPRLRDHGLWDRQDELERVSYRQALLHRKFTLELVRTYQEISGYVITGERDTPISKAGMWTGISEGAERLKFDPSAFAPFNGDVVLSLGWDKRRAWINGGDRAAYWDTFSYVAGSVVRAHVVASNYSRQPIDYHDTNWAIRDDAARILANCQEQMDFILQPGEVREVSIAEFDVPPVDRPMRVTLDVAAADANNRWSLWFFPAAPAEVPCLRVIDPAGRLENAAAQQRGPAYELGAWVRSDDAAAVVLATAWTDEVRDHLHRGGRAIVLLSGHGQAARSQESFRTALPGSWEAVQAKRLLTPLAMPFWREAIKLIEPHPAWGDFPHDGFCDLQFFGMATDHALDSAKLSGARPILRRVDARTAAVHDYAVELEMGTGRLIVSTLRFEGGLGEQPVGLSRNTAAAYLLSCWVKYLGA